MNIGRPTDFRDNWSVNFTGKGEEEGEINWRDCWLKFVGENTWNKDFVENSTGYIFMELIIRNWVTRACARLTNLFGQIHFFLFFRFIVGQFYEAIGCRDVGQFRWKFFFFFFFSRGLINAFHEYVNEYR